MLDFQMQSAPLPPGRVVAVPIIAMARFRRLMLREGWMVDLPRLCADRHYTFKCLALAHTSGDDGLRHAAKALFAAYERDAAPAVVH